MPERLQNSRIRALDSIAGDHNCSELKIAIASAVDSGLYQELVWNGEAAADGMQAIRWLAVSYGLFSLAGMTFTVIPYDALGQDLAHEPASRAELFGTKASFQFAGMIAAIVAMLILSCTFPSSLYRQVDAIAKFGATCVGGFGVAVLLVVPDKIKETVRKEAHKRGNQDLVTVIHSLCTNLPFKQYLGTRVMIAMAFHLPLSQMVSYLKYCLLQENSVKSTAILQLSFLPSLAMYLSWCKKYVRHAPARKLWLLASCVYVVMNVLVSAIPTHVIRSYHVLNFVFPLYLPLLSASSLVAPNLLLGGVLDYDRLRTQEARQALFVMFDHLIVQLLDVFVSSLPALALSKLGFLGNGGCSCGCGVACARPYLRWNCPGDAGFACSAALQNDNQPFFGVPLRHPPCLLQDQRVLTAYEFIMFHIPSSCCVVAIVTLHKYAISDIVGQEIQAHLARRDKGLVAFDPILNEIIRAPGYEATALGLDEVGPGSFSPFFDKLKPQISTLIAGGGAVFALVFIAGFTQPPIHSTIFVIAISAAMLLWSVSYFCILRVRRRKLHAYRLIAPRDQHCVKTLKHDIGSPSFSAKIKAWRDRVHSRKLFKCRRNSLS